METPQPYTKRSEVIVNDQPIPMTVNPHLADEIVEKALESDKFRQWITQFEGHLTLEIEHIELQDIDMFGPENVGFIKLKARVHNVQNARYNLAHPETEPRAEYLPGIVLIRGETVANLIVLQCEGKEYFIIVEQPRAADAQAGIRELVAGMVDQGEDRKLSSSKEGQEEADIKIPGDTWITLNPQDEKGKPIPVQPSGGATFEPMYFEMAQVPVTPEQLQAFLEVKETGAADESEYIKRWAVPMPTNAMEMMSIAPNDVKLTQALMFYAAWKEVHGTKDHFAEKTLQTLSE